MRRGLLATAVSVVVATVVLPVVAEAEAPAGSAEVAGLTASEPALSADGRWVAFVGEVDGETGVYRHDALDGSVRRVATDLRGGRFSDPSISDDGRWVAFAHRVAGEPTQVYRTDVRHDATRRFSATSDGEPGNGDSLEPRVSGDGRHVVFTTRATDIVNRPSWGAGSGPGDDVVVAEQADEGCLVTLVSPDVRGADFSAPSIDADGDRIAFTRRQGGRSTVLLARRAAGSRGGVTLSEVAGGTAPRVSADGSSVAHLRNQVLPGGVRRAATWLRTVGGSEVQADVDDRGVVLRGTSAGVRVGRDGDDVLVAVTGPDGTTALVLRDTAVGTTRTVAEGVDPRGGFDLAADGTHVAHVVDGTLQVTDLRRLPAHRPQAPAAFPSPLVMRAARPARGRGYVLEAAPAGWEPVRSGRVERQWLRSGRVIPGASGPTYEVTAADVGHEVAVRERLVVPGAPTGRSVSRSYRVLPDRSALWVPRTLRARPGAVRLRVRVSHRPGGESYVDGAVAPQGKVRVRVGERVVTRPVGRRGWVTVVLRAGRPGRHLVHVQHLGTPYAAPAPPRTLRLVLRPRR